MSTVYLAPAHDRVASISTAIANHRANIGWSLVCSVGGLIFVSAAITEFTGFGFWALMIGVGFLLGIVGLPLLFLLNSRHEKRLIRSGRIIALDDWFRDQWSTQRKLRAHVIKLAKIDMPNWYDAATQYLEIGDAERWAGWFKKYDDPHTDDKLQMSIAAKLAAEMGQFMEEVILAEEAVQSEVAAKRKATNALLAEELELDRPGPPPVES